MTRQELSDTIVRIGSFDEENSVPDAVDVRVTIETDTHQNYEGAIKTHEEVKEAVEGVLDGE